MGRDELMGHFQAFNRRPCHFLHLGSRGSLIDCQWKPDRIEIWTRMRNGKSKAVAC